DRALRDPGAGVRQRAHRVVRRRHRLGAPRPRLHPARGRVGDADRVHGGGPARRRPHQLVRGHAAARPVHDPRRRLLLHAGAGRPLSPGSHASSAPSTANVTSGSGTPFTSTAGRTRRRNRPSSALLTAAVIRVSAPWTRVSPSTRDARFTAPPTTPYSTSSAVPMTPATTGPRWIPMPSTSGGMPSRAMVWL